MGSGTRKGCAEPGAPLILIVPRRAVRLIVADWCMAAPGPHPRQPSGLICAVLPARAQARSPLLPSPTAVGVAICYSRPIPRATPMRTPGARRLMAQMDSTPAVAFAPGDARFLRDAGWVIVQLPAGLT